MNDFIIFGLLVLAFIEVLFISFRLRSPNQSWVAQKVWCIFLGVFFAMFQLIILIEDTLVGEQIIFHFERLIYEFYVIAAIAIFFILNYFISQIIGKFQENTKEVTEDE